MGRNFKCTGSTTTCSYPFHTSLFVVLGYFQAVMTRLIIGQLPSASITWEPSRPPLTRNRGYHIQKSPNLDPQVSHMIGLVYYGPKPTQLRGTRLPVMWASTCQVCSSTFEAYLHLHSLRFSSQARKCLSWRRSTFQATWLSLALLTPNPRKPPSDQQQAELWKCERKVVFVMVFSSKTKGANLSYYQLSRIKEINWSHVCGLI